MNIENNIVDKPLVSVIVIFYNEELFIEEAINSILAQTYENWELLLVDDGSVDKSTTIAKKFVDKYPEKVFYFEHPGHQNRGMSATRNLGLAHAKGDFIAFLDADDFWQTNKLELQTSALQTRPEVAMVYGPAQWWYSWTGKPQDRFKDFIHELGVNPNTILTPPSLIAQYIRQEGISPCTCSVLIRREIIERIGGFEEIFQGLYEDQAFFAKVSLLAPVFVMSECLAKYRQNTPSEASIPQEITWYKTARKVFLNWLAGYLSTKNIGDKKVWNALKIEMRPYRYPRLYKIIQLARDSFPGRVFRFAHKLQTRWLSFPVINQFRSLQFRRLQPFGNSRIQGTPIVRYYWDLYLQQNRPDICGNALEIGTTNTIRNYGGQALEQANALDLIAHSPEVTVVADLSRADHVPSEVYDCFVIQFTTHLIYDIEAALYHAIRILKPDGVLLINFPCVDYYFPRGLDMGTGEPLFLYWWFTPIQVDNLFRRVGLGGDDYSLKVYGNLFVRMAYQLNLPVEEVTRRELEYSDLGHPLLICARVVKPGSWQCEKPVYRNPWHPDVTPAQWNPTTGHYAK